MTDPSAEKFALDWATRLREIAPFTPAIPREGLFPEETQELSRLYQQIVPYSSDSPTAKEFYERYRQHSDKVRPILSELLPSVTQRFSDFYKNTGIDDYEPIQEYPKNQLGGLFGSAQHEIYAHELPYKGGFMPDYRGFVAGKDEFGNTKIFGPNSVTPYNENAATIVDMAMSNYLKGYEPKISKEVFDDFFVKSLKEAAENVDTESRQTLDERLKSFYPSPTNFSDNYRSAVNEAGKLFVEKYIKPAAEQYEGAVRTQFPGLAEQRHVLHNPGEYQRILGILDRDFAEGRPDVSSLDFYLSADPITSAVKEVPKVLSAIKRTPSSLLPGAADLIPSPEAIRTGYAQGPVEMGKQMAQEFAQSLPTAAGAAMLLSTPALAPLAPGIGAGMVGTAGAKALNEVVRQETGEGIVPKVRQFLGTAPRTGISAPQRRGDQFLTAEIRPLTQAQKQKMNQQATQNEIQRRMELVKERFNPSKGEFGLSELIFGR